MIAAAHKLVLSSSVSYMPFSIFSQMIAAAHELLQYLCVDQVVDNASLWAERAARGPWSGMSEVCVCLCTSVCVCVSEALAILLCLDKEAEGTSPWSRRALGGHRSGDGKVCVCACACVSVYVCGALAVFVSDLTGGKK